MQNYQQPLLDKHGALRFKEIVSEEGLPCANPDGAVVVIGPYEEKTEAVEVLKQIRVSHFIFGELSYKD